jgi:hypothetical protein
MEYHAVKQGNESCIINDPGVYYPISNCLYHDYRNPDIEQCFQCMPGYILHFHESGLYTTCHRKSPKSVLGQRVLVGCRVLAADHEECHECSQDKEVYDEDKIRIRAKKKNSDYKAKRKAQLKKLSENKARLTLDVGPNINMGKFEQAVRDAVSDSARQAITPEAHRMKTAQNLVMKNV